MTNLEWIAAGNTGCIFATLFARKPEQVGWKHVQHTKWGTQGASLMVSVEFPPDWNNRMVREWTQKYPGCFSEENPDDETIGLRVKWETRGETSWVQYFGPDSHVPTRQTPNPMLMYTRKLNPLGYFKQVGFSGILHLAHAFSVHLTDKMVETLWGRSYEQVRKKIGYTPTIKEAAKTTWLKKDVL